MTLVVSKGKTGVGSIEPGTGCAQVRSIDSIDFRVLASTNVYASQNVVNRLRPRKMVYGLLTCFTIESSTYNAGNLRCGIV